VADIFISYAKADRHLVLKLAALFESEGWTVWWDTSLTPGDDFRDAIMTELSNARAVVVVWTDASCKSDWVRSEAGRAHSDRKLIPLKHTSLGYDQIPPPFDVLHTEDIGNTSAVRAGIVYQLSKPSITPSRWWLTTRLARYEALMWLGIVGAALTILTSLQSLLQLASWANWLTENWRYITQTFWEVALSVVGLKLPGYLVPAATFMATMIMVAVGNKLSLVLREQSGPPSGEISWGRFLLVYLTGIWIGFYVLPILPSPINWLFVLFGLDSWLFVGPLFAALLLSRHKWSTVGVYALFLVAWQIITASTRDVPDFSDRNTAHVAENFSFALVFGGILAIVPANRLLRKLFSIAVGVSILVALSELSKLGIKLQPPRTPG
jgi:TIR domain